MIGSLTRSSLANKRQYRSLLAGNEPVSYGAYELISTAYGTGSSGTITFSSIPSTYKHLQIRYAGLTSIAGMSVNMRFNSDTGANYNAHYLYAQGSSVTSGSSGSATDILTFGLINGTSTTIPLSGVIDIVDYASTSKFKTSRSLTGITGSPELVLGSGLWRSTSAISSASLALPAGNWTTASRFSLYGIKG